MDRPARRPGPPVDAARLQPDNQGDIHRVDEGLVGAWLDDPDLAAELADELEQLERLRRLQADEELVLALQLEQFTGRLWARFSRELTRYGLGVLRAWIRHGTIYVKAKKLTGYGLGRIEGWPDDQTIDDIATDTVVAALNYFRDKVLKTHRWQSSGGASLGTFFIGQCLYQFANIYRSALRAELERIEQATTPMDEHPRRSAALLHRGAAQKEQLSRLPGSNKKRVRTSPADVGPQRRRCPADRCGTVPREVRGTSHCDQQPGLPNRS